MIPVQIKGHAKMYVCFVHVIATLYIHYNRF